MMVPEEKSVGSSVGLSCMSLPGVGAEAFRYHGQGFVRLHGIGLGACAAQLPGAGGRRAVAHTR